MMPKLPPPDDVSGHPFRYTANAMLAYGRAVAEACAAICDREALVIGDASGPRLCAAVIREAAKEIK